MHPNSTKSTKHKSLESNGVDGVRSLRKIPTRLCGTNYCTSLTRFALSVVWQPKSPKCTQIVGNATKHEFRVQWGGSGVFVATNLNATSWHKLLYQFGPFCTEFRKTTKRSQMHPDGTKCSKMRVQGKMGWIGCVHREKLRRDFVARTFALIAPVQLVLQLASCSNETIQNAPKHYETHQNMSLGSNGVDRFHSLRKISMRLRGTNFCISYTSSACFVSSIVH